MKINKIIIIATFASLLFNQVVYAARLGSGRSRGMQRSMPTYQYNKNYNNNNYSNTQQNYKPNNQQNMAPQRGGISPAAAALMGAAAGAAGGYMLGKNSANNEVQNNQIMQESVNNTNNQVASTYNNIDNNKNQMPFGIILILLVILLIGIAFFRKKTILPTNPVSDNKYPNNHYSNNQTDNKLDYSSQENINIAYQQNIVKNESIKLPDGIEREFFLRQAKGMFLHIQSMNNKENVSEIAKYLTPELYQSIIDEIQNNEFIADFNNLECELVDSKLESEGLVASVRFNGMVSDSPNKVAEPFCEVWHFLKKDININKWIVAGIQQINS